MARLRQRLLRFCYTLMILDLATTTWYTIKGLDPSTTLQPGGGRNTLKLSDLQAGKRVRGLSPEGVATIKTTTWYGEAALGVLFGEPDGNLPQFGASLVCRGASTTLPSLPGTSPWRG